MNVALPQEIESLIRAKVASGMYRSPEEVLLAAMALLEERDRLRPVCAPPARDPSGTQPPRDPAGTDSGRPKSSSASRMEAIKARNREKAERETMA